MENNRKGTLSEQDVLARYTDSCTCNMGGSENGYFTSTECLGCSQ